jgi:DNA-binding NarL/FixJ family response regulator
MLRLLPGTLSRRRVGRELRLVPNTIKTRSRAIYRKLSVTSLARCGGQGRDLGLV